jgi:hypothetical protein
MRKWGLSVEILNKFSGALQVDESNDLLLLDVPLTFVLEAMDPRAITACQVSDLTLGDTALVHSADVAIFSRKPGKPQIELPVILRAEDFDRTNTITLRIALPDADGISRIIDEKFIRVRLVLTFQGISSIDLDVLVKPSFKTLSVKIGSVQRTTRHRLIFANLAALAGITAGVYAWSNYVYVNVHHGQSLVSPSGLNLLIGIILGFFGLQVAQLLGWFRTLGGLASLYRYPELYLSSPVLSLFRSRLFSAAMMTFAGALLTIAALNWTIRLEEVPRGIIYLDADGTPINEKKVLSRELAAPLRVVCRGSGNAWTSRLSVGLLHRPSILQSPLEVLGITDSKVHYSTFAVKYAGALSGSMEAGGSQSAIAVTPAEFLGKEILQLNVPYGSKAIAGIACGENVDMADGFASFDAGRHLFMISASHSLNQAEIDDLINREQVFLNNIEDARITNDDVVSEIQKAVSLRHYHRIRPSDFMAEYEKLKPRDLSRSMRAEVDAIVKLHAFFGLFQKHAEGRLSSSDLDGLLKDFEAFSTTLDLRNTDTRVISAYWSLMLEIESAYSLYLGSKIHDIIRKSLGRNGTGAEYYVLYLDQCVRRGLFGGYLLSSDPCAKQRAQFFMDRRAKMWQLQNFDDRLGNILRTATDENSKVVLDSLKRI